MNSEIYKANKHRLTNLPKWARQVIDELVFDREEAEQREKNIGNAHSVLHERQWFCLGDHFAPDSRPVGLFVLRHDDPLKICSLGEGDVLLVGRKKETPSKNMADV